MTIQNQFIINIHLNSNTGITCIIAYKTRVLPIVIRALLILTEKQ